VSVEDESTHRVLAVVLTHNAPESLARCLNAIDRQTSPPDEVLVVDNASDPPVTDTSAWATSVPVTVLRSDTNVGPAGGYALALGEFLARGVGHAWVLDDDIVPDPTCLAALWLRAEELGEPAFVFPRSVQPDGSIGHWGSWCGFLVAREIIESVGLPMKELFWWAEDTEYCHWRIPQAGYTRRMARNAVVHHHAVRHGRGVPVWKYYYEARNMLYLHLHVMHRVGWYPRNLGRLVARAVLRERRGRLRRLWVIGRGLFDGLSGRLGIRYPVEPMREQRSRAHEKVG
jgi:hypothetical protein